MRPAPAHTLLSALLLAGALSACSSDSPRSGATTDTATSQSEQVTTPTAAPAATDLTAVEGSDESDLGCGEPPQHLIDGLGTSSDTRPGPVIGAVVVFAATTDTGDWYVLGVDRLHEDEAGGTTPGDGSRSLALTNAVNPPVSGDPTVIPLGTAALGEQATASWERVTWTGETLQSGRAAAERAVDCLDEIS